tara:strand:+ start:224 stop:622 length:399 start_codon:yes stop_codon:yes gene_type:complete
MIRCSRDIWLNAVLLAAISASTEPLLSDSLPSWDDEWSSNDRPKFVMYSKVSSVQLDGNPQFVAVQDELKAVRVEMAAAEAEHQKALISMRSELLEALKPAKTQAVLAIKLLLVCPQLHAGMSHSCGPSQAF